MEVSNGYSLLFPWSIVYEEIKHGFARVLDRLMRGLLTLGGGFNDSNSSRHYITVFIAILLASLFPLFYMLYVPQSVDSRGPSLNDALTTFLIPTKHAWPSQYLPLLNHWTEGHPGVINIPMSDLFASIRSGDFELRDNDDILDMFRDRMYAYGWTIRFYSDWYLHMRVIRAVLYLSLRRFKLFLLLASYIAPRKASKNTPGLQEHPVDLDFLPYHELKTSISGMASSLPPGMSMLMEFTTISTQVAFLSGQFMMCALPFLPREYSVDRTTTLFASLQYLIKLLTTEKLFVITAVKNVSVTRSADLKKSQEDLVSNSREREAFIEVCGLEKWREHMLLLVWEMNLLRAGLLNRWQVLVRKH